MRVESGGDCEFFWEKREEERLRGKNENEKGLGEGSITRAFGIEFKVAFQNDPISQMMY